MSAPSVCQEFLVYLWGIETCRKRTSEIPGGTVFSLPMRNWNSHVLDHVSLVSFPVFSLPMRNWNSYCNTSTRCWSMFLVYLWGIETHWGRGHPGGSHWVFSLPMRNWNVAYRAFVVNLYLFLVYLWGIETHLLCRLLLPELLVFSLPMRNWNPALHEQRARK